MKNARVALAFAGGYLFGRGHRVRSALALAGVAAGKRLASGRAPAGAEQLKSTELGRLAREVRGQLMSAGRTAAMSAASNRIDSLSDRLEKRASSLRSGPDGAKAEKPQKPQKPQKSEEAESEAANEGREDKAASRSRGNKPKKSADRPSKAKKETGAGGSGRRSQG
jgi:hypothetical protein